jgi:hypothetical protein
MGVIGGPNLDGCQWSTLAIIRGALPVSGIIDMPSRRILWSCVDSMGVTCCPDWTVLGPIIRHKRALEYVSSPHIMESRRFYESLVVPDWTVPGLIVRRKGGLFA